MRLPIRKRRSANLIRALVGQGEAASVAALVRVGRQFKPGLVAIFADRKPGGAPV
jgi:hypothetical protein